MQTFLLHIQHFWPYVATSSGKPLGFLWKNVKKGSFETQRKLTPVSYGCVESHCLNCNICNTWDAILGCWIPSFWLLCHNWLIRLSCDAKENCLRVVRPGQRQTRQRWLETWNFGFRSKRVSTICVAKRKTLISCASFLVTRLILNSSYSNIMTPTWYDPFFFSCMFPKKR